jgi:hypothetical protein
MRQKFEKVQKGNPHKLRVNQHVWPRKSIARFVDATNRVWLFDKAQSKPRRAKPDDSTFCAKRVWDQRAEAGYMKDIEDAFQEVADEIIAGVISNISGEQKEKVDAFFALWRARSDFKTADAEPIKFRRVTGYKWPKDQQEQFEKGGILFLRDDGFPARMAHGLAIQREIDDYMCALSSVRWGIIHIQEGHLVVPDCPAYTIIPLTPTLCLCHSQSGTITKQNVAELNRALKFASRQYFFAQDFVQCP